MGGKQSTNTPRGRTFSGSTPGTSGASEVGLSGTANGTRARARSLGTFATGSAMGIPNGNGDARGAGSPDSDSSTPEDGPIFGRPNIAHSLPLHLFALHARARSLGTFATGSAMGIPNGNGDARGAGSPDSDSSTPEDGPIFGRPNIAHSLPLHLFALHGIKCPVCAKFVPPDDLECHLVICLTKPRITYNEDVLKEDKGECVICFEDLNQGDTIARLPCLCIYHKGCIDKWFERNRSCPEHPQD